MTQKVFVLVFGTQMQVFVLPPHTMRLFVWSLKVLCLHRFSQSYPVSFHGPKVMHMRSLKNTKLPVGFNVSVNGSLSF